MGCTDSKNPAAPNEPAKPAAPGAAPPAAEAPGKNMEVKKKEEKLLDKYTLGKSIGQGAFGIVYSCKLNASSEEFAVKMIDPVETPLAEITREVEMLRLLAHPCVVAMKDVFYEKVFVCLVMEIYKGGDMIEGMQLHWKSKGQIPIPVIQNVSKMMVQGVEWLHQNSIVHRDLKGDNFLQSVKHIEDKKCRIYMSDFGTVIALNPCERLTQKCGTKTYWAPEFYRMDYGLPVDVWALGVIMFGLVTGRFPFKGESDVKGKDVKMPARATKDGESFIGNTLKKKEDERMTATQCIQHKFMASMKSAAEVQMEVGDNKDEKTDADGVGEVPREFGANAGVKQRRRDLVNRLVDKGGNRTAMIDKDFEVEDKQNEKTTRFEWWSAEKCTKFTESGQSKPNEQALFSEADVKRTMAEHNISADKFGQGQAKKLSEFMDEIQSGESRLMLDATRHKNMVRVIDLVLLRIVYGTGQNKRYLIKLSETFPDGRVRDRLNNLPGTKKRPHENGRQVCERMMKERMNMTGSEVVFDYTAKEYMEDDEESPSYPGVRTVYRKEFYEGVVTTKDPEVLKRLGLSTDGSTTQYVCKGEDEYTRTFFWASEGACFAKGIKFRAPKEGFEISPLVPTPVGYNEEELQTFLEENNVSLDAFAKSGAGSLAKLAEELQMGDAALNRMPDGRIMRVVEVIVLQLKKKNGDMLVQAWQKDAAGSKKGERLPGVKRRQDENLFWAAHRAFDSLMKINENMVTMDPDKTVLIEEEKPSEVYTNLPTIYRRRIIPCTLVEE